MNTHPELLCIGSALWDTIGRYDGHMASGQDRPGRIRRIPGGVALNIALVLARRGLTPKVLTCLGQDPDGDALAALCAGRNVDLSHALRHDTLPTDAYMAIEDANGLIAAIADAHSLEAAGTAILTPLFDGTFGDAQTPFAGCLALDGNLTTDVLEQIAVDSRLQDADLRVAPASPGKADRLLPFVTHGRGTLYVNREEANLLSATEAQDAYTAARALIDCGARRVIVTDGVAEAVDMDTNACHRATPPTVPCLQVTGAGDTLMAVHIAAELQGTPRQEALHDATVAAAHHVAGEDI